MNQRVRNLLILPVMAGAVIGCAASDNRAPTHRWASSDVANKAEYRIHHAQCASQAGLDGAQQYQADSDTFVVYKQCMNDNGYVLTAYRGHD